MIKDFSNYKDKKSWTTTKLITIGGLVVFWILLSFLAAGIQLITGIVGAAGITAMLTSTMVLVLCSLIIKKFGAATFMGLIFGFLALPLATMGTPGFLPKIFIATSAGFITDLIYCLFRKREKLFVLIEGLLIQFVIGFQVLGFTYLFKVPGIEMMIKALLSYLVISVPILSLIGAFLGYLIYKKLQNTAVVKRIQV